MDCLTNNIIERLKFSSIGWPFDNIIYKINPVIADYDDFPFDGYQRLITRRLLYCIHDNIVFSMNNGLSVYIKMNQM